MAKMGDLYINWGKIGEGTIIGFDAANGEDGTYIHTFTPSDDAEKPTADLSQIEADLEKLPQAVHGQNVMAYQQSYLSYIEFKKYAEQMYGVPGKFLPPILTPEQQALRKALDALEQKLTEMQYGQSQTMVVPIYEPPTTVAYDPGIPPKLTIKTLSVTIRLED